MSKDANSKICDRAGQMTATVATAAMNQADCHVNAVYVGIGAMSGVLSTLAAAVGSVDGQKGAHVSNDSLLFAALLAV